MLFPFGNLDNGMKVYHVFFEPIRVSPEDRVRAGRPRVNLTAHQDRV